MRRLYRLLVGATAMLLVLTPDVSHALIPLRLTGWDGSVELGGFWENQESETATLQTLRGEERVRLGFEGFSVDPQFIRLMLRGGFGFSQEDLTQNGQDLGSNGRLLDYDLQAHLLEQKPVSLTVFGNRNQEIVSRELALRTEVRNENYGAAIRFKELLIPSSFSYRHEEIFQESSSGGIITQWDRVGENFLYEGGRHWDDMDMNLQYRYEEVEDLIRPSFSYRDQQGSFFHRVLFGPDHKDDLTTTARYFYRYGPSPFVSGNLYASEQATLRPTGSFTTSLGFIVNRAEIQQLDIGLDQVTTSYTGFVNLTHQLYESLTSRLMSDVVVTDLPAGTEKQYDLRPSLNYRKRIPGEGLLLLELDGQYEWVDRGGLSQTTQEQHLAPQAFNSFDLNSPIATISGLTITNLDLGITLVENSDYQVTVAADHATITIITSDTNRVSVGNRLLVTYQAITVFPTRGFGTLIGFDFSWIALSYQYQQQEQLSSNGGSLLDNIIWDTVDLQFRFHPGKTNILFLNEYRRYSSTPLAYRQWQFNQVMTYLVSNRLTASLQAAESLTDYKIPVRETEHYDVRTYLTWRPAIGKEVSPFAAYRRYEDTVAPSETVKTVGLRGRLTWAKLEFLSFIQYDSHHRTGSDISDYQVDLRLIRRF